MRRAREFDASEVAQIPSLILAAAAALLVQVRCRLQCGRLLVFSLLKLPPAQSLASL